MASYFLILLILFVHFLSIYAQVSTSEKPALVQNGRTKSIISHMEVLIQRPETGKRKKAISCRGHTRSRHSQRHLKNVHGILILVGWGTLLPIGVIIARYCRGLPVKWNQWFRCHILCQTLGYILGTIGWCIGLWLGTASKHYASKMQHAISVIAFTVINIQMLSTFMIPNKDTVYRKWWNIWHHAVGYTVIGMIIANIFVGINNEKSETKELKWAYVAIIGLLIMVTVPLQMFKCKFIVKEIFRCS